ncbi:MAG: DNA-processing protein DprA [Pseudomonadota bacterium]
MDLPLINGQGPASGAISPLRELGAYEALWLKPKASFRTLARQFAASPGSLPSDFVPPTEANNAYREVRAVLEAQEVASFGVRIHGSGDYTRKLRDACEPVELLYYRGTWELAYQKAVSIVGTRKPSQDGKARAKRLAQLLAAAGYAIVSGLAEGIDTVAHETAIGAGGRTIAVIGTPIGRVYPRANARLQEEIAARHLLISQVPILHYERNNSRNPVSNRWFFPERNKTMSALTRATIIVEAGETSGTLTQARAALRQGRRLLLLDSLFGRQDLKWPQKFVERGAVRVRTEQEILDALADSQAHAA